VHSLTHPSARIERPATAANGVKGDEGVVPVPAFAADEPHRDATELMATLAHEHEKG
jgi:hypothetical protein